MANTGTAVTTEEPVLDPYAVLGVEKTATDDEIKQAYRKLALQHHPDKQKSEAEAADAAETFQKIVTSYNILKDPERRRKHDAGVSVDMDHIEVDASDLGKLDTALLAMLSKFGVGIKTSVSKHVLTAVENGDVTARRLSLNEPITDKVDKQSAHFYEIVVTKEDIEKGFFISAHAAPQHRLKLLLFDKASDGSWSLMHQEDSRRVGRHALVDMYFFGHDTFHLLPPSINPLEPQGPQDPLTEFFGKLSNYVPRDKPQLAPGMYLVGVYGDNWFKRATYTLQVLSKKPNEGSAERLKETEAKLLEKKGSLPALEKEFTAAKEAFMKVVERVDAEHLATDALLKERDEAYLELHHVLHPPIPSVSPPEAAAKESSSSSSKPAAVLSGFRLNNFNLRRRPAADKQAGSPPPAPPAPDVPLSPGPGGTGPAAPPPAAAAAGAPPVIIPCGLMEVDDTGATSVPAPPRTPNTAEGSASTPSAPSFFRMPSLPGLKKMFGGQKGGSSSAAAAAGPAPPTAAAGDGSRGGAAGMGAASGQGGSEQDLQEALNSWSKGPMSMQQLKEAAAAAAAAGGSAGPSTTVSTPGAVTPTPGGGAAAPPTASSTTAAMGTEPVAAGAATAASDGPAAAAATEAAAAAGGPVASPPTTSIPAAIAGGGAEESSSAAAAAGVAAAAEAAAATQQSELQAAAPADPVAQPDDEERGGTAVEPRSHL